MIDVVLTSCGRLDLLEKTIGSFFKYNTCAINNFILIDDSGNTEVHEKIRGKYKDFVLILDPQNNGYIECIDKAYGYVSTEYFFTTEDDWEFIRGGFIEKSLKIMKANPNILQVWIRGYEDTNGHPLDSEVFYEDDVEYRLLSLWQHGYWHGFSLNPSVRRLSDYKKIAPYSQYDKDQSINVRECRIGQKYFDLGYRAASLKDQHCYHIGESRTTYVH